MPGRPEHRSSADRLLLLGVVAVLRPFRSPTWPLYRWQSLAVFIWGGGPCHCLSSSPPVGMAVPDSGDDRHPRDGRRPPARQRSSSSSAVAGLLTALLGLRVAIFVAPFPSPTTPTFSPAAFKQVARARKRLACRCGGCPDRRSVLLFVGLTQAPNFRAHQPDLRRLLYGYNADPHQPAARPHRRLCLTCCPTPAFSRSAMPTSRSTGRAPAFTRCTGDQERRGRTQATRQGLRARLLERSRSCSR